MDASGGVVIGGGYVTDIFPRVGPAGEAAAGTTISAPPAVRVIPASNAVRIRVPI